MFPPWKIRLISCVATHTSQLLHTSFPGPIGHSYLFDWKYQSVWELWSRWVVGEFEIVNYHVGMIPAPVLFGFLIDHACVSWHQATCSGDKGACLVYDNWAMGTYLLVLVFACKSLSFGFFILAICLYRSRHVHTTINVVMIPDTVTSSTVTGSELQPLAVEEQGKQESVKT